MTYSPSTVGSIDANNTSTSTLAGAAVFTGTGTDVSAYASVSTTVYSDVASADNGFTMQFSTNNSTFFTVAQISLAAGTTVNKSVAVQGRYFRVVYTNGGSSQNAFRLQTSLQVESSVTVAQPSFTSQVNTNFSTLGAGATWTGIYEDVSSYNQIITNFKATQAGTFTMSFSSDGTNTHRSIGPYTLAANSDSPQPLAPIRKFYRASYTNTSGSTATLYIETRYLVTPAIFQTRVSDALGVLSTALTARTVLYGPTDSLNYSQANVTNDGHLEVAVHDPVGAFGEVLTVEAQPVAQLDFVYNTLNNQNVSTTTASGGTVTAANRLAVLTSGTTDGGSASMRSLRQAVYRPGQGVMARYTAIFTTGVANTTQIAGVGNATDGYFFGYNGTSFGILHRNNSVDTWVAQSSWNQDVMDGTSSSSNPSAMNLDKTKGNVFQIKYQYLGFGDIKFYIESADTAEISLVHIIRYANANTATSLSNPSLPLYWHALCTSGGVSVVLKTASGALFLEGQRKFLGPKYGLDNNKATITTLTNIITIKCITTFNSITNNAQIRIRNISVATANGGTAGVCTLQVISNTTLGGSPSYTNVDATNSIAQYDTAGTTITGGIVVFNTSVASNGNAFFDTTDLGILINPGDILTFAVKATQSTTAAVSLCWSEDI